MLNSLTLGLLFLVQIIFGFYILIVMLRLLLQLVYANYYNPISQFIVNFTNFLVKPLRRIIPGFKGVDFAIVVLLLTLQIIEIVLIIWLQTNKFPGIIGLIPWSIGSLLSQLSNIFFYALVIRVILSWIAVSHENSVFEITYALTEPLLKPLRRFIPLINGFDLSPIVVAIILKFLAIVLLVPLIQWGQALSLQ